MPIRVIHFLRPTFFALIAFGLVAGIGDFLLAPPSRDPEFTGPAGLSPDDLGEMDLQRVVLPRPELSPEAVVRLQLAGLSNPKTDGVGILQCYCFASMVRQGPYLSMAQPRAVLVGRPEVRDRVARLLVTVIDQQSQVQAFTFVLGRQRGAPFEDCWMTEAVFPALPQPEPTPEPRTPTA
jgi:hypothetical protein